MGSIVELSGWFGWQAGGPLLVALALLVVAMAPSAGTAEQGGAATGIDDG